MKIKLIIAFLLINSVKLLAQEVESLKKYNDDKLYWVTTVETKQGLLYVNGYKDENETEITVRKIKLAKNELFTVNNYGWHFSPSLMTIPYKIRPKNEYFPTEAQSGLSNLGLNSSVYGYKRDRYFIDGDMSKHKFDVGFWVGPSVEELNTTNTGGFLVGDKKSKQLFLSAGLTFTYSYNNVNFSFVPLGYDLAISTIGKEAKYNKRWWGFGIGIDPKIFNFLSSIKQ